MEKYGSKDVIDLFVFDEEGKLITALDSLQKSMIVSNKEDNYIFAKDALLDVNLLRFQQNSNVDIGDDFKTLLNQIKGVPIVVNKNNKSKKCKLIAKTAIRNVKTSNDEYIYYEIPKAEITNELEINNDNCDPSTFDMLFKIIPSDNGDLFMIHGL